MTRVYGCEALSLVSPQDLAADLGTDVYHGGVLDRDGGHLHPLDLALGMARAVLAAGGRICEQTPALSWTRRGGAIEVTTPAGRIICDRLILTGDGYLSPIAGAARDRVMPINNFVLVTEPLGDRADQILRSGAAAADTRFVVNYFRKTADGRLLFGGGETYRQTYPADLAGYVRRSLVKIYPDLAGIRITHAWGGSVGVTLHRTPHRRRASRWRRDIRGRGSCWRPMSATFWGARRWGMRRRPRPWRPWAGCLPRPFPAGAGCAGP
jgi:gamma-glutamylputrescine oxidase